MSLSRIEYECTPARMPVVGKSCAHGKHAIPTTARENSVANMYLYNGFERQDGFEWYVYDYTNRHYDATIGRFLQIDPAADLMRRYSPFVYGLDNPIRYLDPDGMFPETFNEECDEECKKKKAEEAKKRKAEFDKFIEEAKKKGDLITVYTADRDATNFDGIESFKATEFKIKDLENKLSLIEQLADNGGTMLDLVQLAYEIAPTDVQVKTFAINKGLSRTNTIISAYNLGTEVFAENYDQAALEVIKFGIGRTSLGPILLGAEAFYHVGKAGVPQEIRNLNKTSRVNYMRAMSLRERGYHQQARQYFQKAIQQEQSAMRLLKQISQ